MNLIQEVDQTLAKNDWDLYTISRYLYLKSCEAFTYDYRYYYGSRELIQEIRNRKIDLQKIEDNRVVCESWARQVYIPLLNHVGIQAKLMGEGRGHQFVQFGVNDMEIAADACVSSDLARVKMKNNTVDFYPIHSSDFVSKIAEMDQEIGYLKDQYSGNFILKGDQLEERFQNEENPSLLNYDDEFLIYKLYYMKSLLESYPDLKQFSDCQFCLNYLRNKILNDDDCSKILETDLYCSYFDDWDFMRIYEVRLSHDRLYFSLINTENDYMFYEMPEGEVKKIKRSYKKNNLLKF